jgi:hypothetical protein
VHAPDGRAITVELLHRGNEWQCNFPMRTDNGIEWRLLVANTKKALMEFILRASRQNTPTIRDLNESERLNVARLCTAKRLQEALVAYLEARLGDKIDQSVLSDPRYRQVCDDCALFIFINSTPDYVDTPETREYLIRHAAGRPLSLPILRAGHSSMKEAQKQYDNDLRLNPAPPEPVPTEEAIEQLPDSEVNRLFSGVRRQRAQSQFRGPIAAMHRGGMLAGWPP